MAGWDDAISGLGDSFAGAITSSRKKKAAQDFITALLGTQQINPLAHQVAPQIKGGPVADPNVGQPAMTYQGGLMGSDPMMQKMAPILAALGNSNPEAAQSLVLPALLKQFEAKPVEVYKPGDVGYAQGNYSNPLFSIPEKPDKPPADPEIMRTARFLFPTDPGKQRDYVIKNSASSVKAIAPPKPIDGAVGAIQNPAALYRGGR